MKGQGSRLVASALLRVRPLTGIPNSRRKSWQGLRRPSTVISERSEPMSAADQIRKSGHNQRQSPVHLPGVERTKKRPGLRLTLGDPDSLPEP